MPIRRLLRPFDLVLDHSTLERVPRDAKKVGSLNDAAGFLKRGLTQGAFGFAKVEVFQEYRHELRIRQNSHVGKPFLVMAHTRGASRVCAIRAWIMNVSFTLFGALMRSAGSESRQSAIKRASNERH